MARLSALALAAVLAGAAGCYAPNPESGTLLCSSDQRCPEGYSCHAEDLKCWKGSPADLYVGHWVFDSNGMVTRSCNDGLPNDVTDLKDVFIDFSYPAATDAADATAVYLCPWKLDIAPGGRNTTLHPGLQSCSTTDVSGTSIYKGQSFTFSTDDGKVGTLAASISAEGGGVTCTLAVTGSLTNKS